MDDAGALLRAFEARRARLQAVAYRMLGSLPEAEDAVQETWLRLCRPGVGPVDNLDAWLTTVVARVCLNVLRARRRRGEEPFGVHLPDPVVTADDGGQPEEQAVLADSVGLALLIVLETLSPPERIAFVLHDVFGVPFGAIAPIVERSEAAARQLASRARRRVRGAEIASAEADRTRQRQVVDAFFAAAQGRSLEALMAVLDPEVVLRSDAGDWRPQFTMVVRGVEEVARWAVPLPNSELLPVRVNGAAGVLVLLAGQPFSIMAFTVRLGRITEIVGIADPARVRRLSSAVLDVRRQR